MNPRRRAPHEGVAVLAAAGGQRGELIAIVAGADADRAVEVLRAHPLGAAAVRIGTVVPDHPTMVVARTALGGTRVIDLPIGEQLPRIC